MKTLDLSLHVGTNRVDLDGLEKVKTPERQGIWCPIPHDRLVNGVRGALVRSGLKVVHEAHALAHDGDRYFGLLQLSSGNGSHADAEDYGIVVGLRNSHDKTFPAGLVVGSSVFVCDNLAFSGEISIARKHTTNIGRDLPQLIEAAVGQLGDARKHQSERISLYKGTELSDARVHDLLIQSVDARIVPISRVPDVLNEWRTPSHPEFAASKSGWRLFNAYTEVLKGSNLFSRPRATQALHGLLDTACGMAN